MLDYTSDKWNFESDWLHSTFHFKSYSDARLAELCFDDELPIALLQKVLRVIFDPQFKMEDVTFKSAWDICRYVSDCRKENVRTRTVAVNSSAANEHTSVATIPGVVPPVILHLVVDQFMDERELLTDVAPWEDALLDAFCRNSVEFRNMSLVHRSWTSIAQRGLRRRVVVGCRNIENFLFNPFCGSQVTEMVIDWKFTDGRSFPTDNDIRLLDELLLCTPNVRSLVFNTSLSWLRLDRCSHSLEADACLEIIAERLPCLENLWLAHVSVPDPTFARCRPSPYEDLVYCPGGPELCEQLSKLLSLKFLSIRGWGSGGRVDCDTHLSSQLQSVELDYYQGITEAQVDWLFAPGGEDNLESLSISVSERIYHYKDRTPLKYSLSKIKRLAFYVDRHIGYNPPEDLLSMCEELVSLDFHARYGYGFIEKMFLPPSLERLSVHYYDGSISNHFPNSSELTPAGQVLVGLVQRNLPRLPRLRTLLVTTRESTSEPGEPVQDSLPEQLLDICRDHGVEVNR